MAPSSVTNGSANWRLQALPTVLSPLNPSLLPAAAETADAKLTRNPNREQNSTSLASDPHAVMCNAAILTAMRQVGEDLPRRTRISAFVRVYQGTKRCVYKPERRPDWWPQNVPFAAPGKLCAADLRMVEEAAVEHAEGRAERGDGGVRLRKQSEEIVEFVPSQKEESVAAVKEESNILKGDAEDRHTLCVKAKRSDVSFASFPAENEESAGNDSPLKAEDKALVEVENDALAEAENSVPPEKEKSFPAGVGDDIPTKAKSDVPTEAKSDVPTEAKSDVPTEAKNDVVAEAENEYPIKDIGDAQEVQMLTSAAPTESDPSVELDPSSSREEDTPHDPAPLMPPPPPPSKAEKKRPKAKPSAALLAAAAIPHDEELDALVEDAERITQAAIDQIIITRTLHKRNLIALLKNCCDDIMEKAQLINQRLPTHIQQMSAHRYILEHGGDPGSVMEEEIIRRWKEELENFAGPAAADREAFARRADESESPARSREDGKIGTLRERAARAVTTARKMNRSAVAETPSTVRRSARNAATGTESRRVPSYVRRREERAREAVGLSTVARIANKQETARFKRHGGIVKAVPARRARESDVIVSINVNGSPLEFAPGSFIAAPLSAEKSTASSRDDDNESSIKAAIEQQRAKHKHEMDQLMKRLAETRRREGQSSVRKMR